MATEKQPTEILQQKEGHVVPKKEAEYVSGTLAQVFGNAEPYDWWLMAVGTLGTIVTGSSIPAFNILFGQMMDVLNRNPSGFESAVNQLCIYYVIVSAANIAFGFIQVYFWTATGERQTQKLRERYVNAILSQEIGWFDNCGANELAAKVAELIGKVSEGTGRRFADFLQLSIQLVASFAVAFYQCWQLALLMMVCVPMIAVSSSFLVRAIAVAQHNTVREYSLAGGLATETINSIRTITALNMQPDAITQYRRYLFNAMRFGIEKGFSIGFWNGCVFMSMYLTYSLGFWYGAKLVADGVESNCTDNCVTGGTVISCFFCIVMGAFALGLLAPPLSAFVSAKAAVGTIHEIIDRIPLIDGLSNEGERPDVKVSGEIRLENLNFCYPARPNITVCNNYNLLIQPGETVALVGASGSGKSTIINLLLRFYDPQSGSIQLDGFDIKTLNVKWLRSYIGYVGQEPVLFAGSVGDNIAYGLNDEDTQGMPYSSKRSTTEMTEEERQAALKEKIIAAATLANAHDFINAFPKGYDTDVGSNGIAMSGGQKQRIAIARALIKKPAVLLLDEATSALDAASERVVQQSIDALASRKAQTTIIVAHRLSTIRNADKIVVVDQGKIVEIGTHDELLSLDGKYADLVRLQMQANEDSTVDGKSDLPKEEDITAVVDVKVDYEQIYPNNSASTEIIPADEIEGLKDTLKVQAVVEPSTTKESDLNDKIVEEKKKRSIVYAKLRGMLLRYPRLVAIAALGAMFYGGTFPAWGVILGRSQSMFYSTDAEEIRSKAVVNGSLFILFAVVVLISSTALFYGNGAVCEKVASTIRSEMFESILRRDIRFFDYEENSAGSLTTQLADDSMTIHRGFGEVSAKQLQALFTLVIALCVSFSASWKISLIVLACFPLIIFAAIIRTKSRIGIHTDNKTEEFVIKAKVQERRRKIMAEKKALAARKNNKEQTSELVSTTEEDDEPIKEDTTMSGGSASVISTAFTHMRTVSAFSMHHKVSHHYATLTRDVMYQRIQNCITFAAGFGISTSMQYLVYALVFWFGAQEIIHHRLSFEDMMVSLMTQMMGVVGLGNALRDMGDQEEAIVVAEEVFQTIEESHSSPIDGIAVTGIIPGERAIGRIELKNVFFRYPTRPNVEVCKGYNLVIESGQTVALVGPSGSGKSTIINLLLRFYDPLSGEILLDGKNIQELNVRWLRSQIGYVGQEPVLFAGSVGENVARGKNAHIDQPIVSLQDAIEMAQKEYDEAHPGEFLGMQIPCYKKNETQLPQSRERLPSQEKPDDVELGRLPGSALKAVDEDVIEACKAANAHEFITSFPQQYDTDIGEGSIMVSGGQKQRIAIARALIKKPAVLLLDEATSALDAASERVVQQSIDALASRKAQTTIIVAHRLSTIRNADKIVVVDQGKIVEIGTHDELVQHEKGLYRQLWEKQIGVSPH